MSLKKQILALHAVGYKSNEIVNALRITHETYRNALYLAGIPLPTLSYDGRMEIREIDSDDLQAIAKRFHTSIKFVQECKFSAPEQLDDKRPSNDDLRLMDSTMTPEEIANHLGVNVRKVDYWLNLLPGHSQRLDDHAHADINRRLQRGETQASIAKLYGVTAARICQISKSSKAQKHNKNPDWNSLLRDYAKGSPVSTLTKKYKVSKAAVYAQIKRSN